MKKLLIFILLVSVYIPSSAQRTDLSGLKFCFDPGHGGYSSDDRHVIPDPGIDFWESESNFQKALHVKSLLEAKGATVVLTRYTNNYPNNEEPSLSARYTVANANNVNWFHSIHSNAFNGATNYTLMLVKENISTRQAQFPGAVTMSDFVGKQIVQKLRTGSTSTRLDYTFYGGPGAGYNLGVLVGANMPSELSEGSFHDYYPETRKLMNNSYRKMEAYAIVHGFMQNYSVVSDSLCIVAGIQKESDYLTPKNGTVVRILPENRLYNGDSFNNGFYMFDSLAAGPHVIRFETPQHAVDSVSLTLQKGTVSFVDFTLLSKAPPIVRQSIPLNNDTGCVNTASIEITFSKVMDTASVRSAFSIVPQTDGKFGWKNSMTTVTFAPSSYFRNFTNFTVTIDGSAKSQTGLPFDGNLDGIGGDVYRLNFKTQFPKPPVVAQTIPIKNDQAVSADKQVGIRFSKSMDTSSVRRAFSITPSITGVISFGMVNTVIYFKPNANFVYNQSYAVTIDAKAFSFDSIAIDGNSDGTPGDPYILSFKTISDPNSVRRIDNIVPSEFSLSQNYPNPFNPATTIRFAIPSSSSLSIQLYDGLGRKIRTAVQGEYSPGFYEVHVDLSEYPSGIYYYRMTAGEINTVRRMTLSK